MTIITNLQVDSNLKTSYETESYHKTLAKGEAWEELVFQYLREQGLSADRYKQDLSCLRRNGKLKLFTRFQRDGYIHLPWGRINIEVKARSKKPFDWGTVHVGKQSSWDVKAYPVHFLIVVCQDTGLMKVVRADRNIRETRWLKTTSKDECYTVPIGYFMSIERFIQLLKSGRIPVSHHAREKFGDRFDGMVQGEPSSMPVRLEP